MSPDQKWEWVTLDKLGKVESGKPYSKKYEFNPKLHEKSIPFVGVKEVCRSKLHILKSDRYYFLNRLVKRNNKLFPKNTVCITYRGSTGDSILLKNYSFLSWSLHGFSSIANISDPKFIKYCFDYPRMKEKLMKLAKSSTAQPNLTIKKLLSIKFPCPTREIQQRIGDILSAYDELIENNEQQIEILERVRTLIYKQWFGEFYKKNAILPKEWRFEKLENLVTIKKGTKPASHAIKIEPGGGNKYKLIPSLLAQLKLKNPKHFLMIVLLLLWLKVEYLEWKFVEESLKQVIIHTFWIY